MRSHGRVCIPLLTQCLQGAASALATLVFTASALFAQTTPVRVDLSGLEGQLRDNASAVTAIFGAADEGQLSSAQVRRLHNLAPEEITQALQPFGFYRPSILAELSNNGQEWVARYDVDVGPPMLVRHVDVSVLGAGALDPAFESVIDSFPLVEGDTLRHDLYEQGKQALARLAAERGYLDAVFETNEIRIDTVAYSAEIILHLTSGPRYLFGPVSFNQEVLDSRLLSGYVTFPPGEPFEVAKLRALQRELSATSYFSQVEVVQLRDSTDGLQVPLQIDLVPRRPRAYEIGFGYGTDTGFRGSLEAKLRRLNRRGHNASFKIDVSSEIARSFTAQYRFPPIYPRTAAYTISAGIGDFSPTWSSSLNRKAGIHRSQNRFALQEVLSLSYEATSFEIGQQEGSSHLVIPSVSWTYSRSDDPVVATRGGRLSLLLKGSSDAVLSSASFFQVLVDGKIVRSLGSRIRVLSRAQFGKTFTKQFDELPPRIRFVTGGDQTVRGYGYESLGPLDQNGDVVGGDIVLAGSFELEYRPLSKIGFAAFVDAGNALDSFSDLSLELGTGIGLRWVTPVGYVRLDLAQPLTESDRGLRLHFTIGPDF